MDLGKQYLKAHTSDIHEKLLLNDKKTTHFFLHFTQPHCYKNSCQNIYLHMWFSKTLFLHKMEH